MNILSLIFTIISAVILSSSFAQTRPPCSNDAAAPGYNACEATPICDFDGYCGRTTPDYKPMSAWHELKKGICDATPMLGGLDCMSLENDGYLKFIASASTISFNIYVYDCKKSGTNAIQVAFFSADNCSSGPVEVHFAEPKLVQQAAPHLITVNNLTPGKVYYILIDGYSGKDCGYTFEAVDGVALPEVKIDIAPNHTVCSGENIVANASGGEENSYLWNDITGGSTFSSTSNTTTTITPPTNPGTYTYSVESTGGNAFCPDNSSDTLTLIVEDCGPCPNLIINDISSCDQGTFDLNDAIDPSSDAATTTFYNTQSDDENATNATGNNVTASGTYWVRAEDPSDPTCFNVYQINVSISDLSYSATITGTSCGNTDGEIILTASGGTANYSYSIDNGATSQNNGNFSGLAAGSYNISITDANSCKVTGTEMIGNADGPSIDNINSTDPSCFEKCDGNATVEVSGGALPYTYVWIDANGTPIGINSESTTDLCNGDYTVEITDDNGCSVSGNVVITEPQELDATFTGLDNKYCTDDGSI